MRLLALCSVLLLLALGQAAAAEPLAASIMPIENPVPSWASPSDVCVRGRTCDDCNLRLNGPDSAYCKYSETGESLCCARAGNEPPHPDVFQRPHVILEEEASSTSGKLWSSVSKIAGAVAEGVSTLVGHQHPEAGSNDTPLTLSASIMPIKSSSIPMWARESDQCAGIRQCDDCVGKGAYCKYSDMGMPICCFGSPDSTSSLPTDPTAGDADDDAVQLTASIMPIESNRLPAWANPDTDTCTFSRSCDECQGENQYCTYTPEGSARCCRASSSSGAATASPSSSSLPSWASSIDMCSRVRSCSSCPRTDWQYCKSTRYGHKACCLNVEREQQHNQQQQQQDGAEEPMPLEASIAPIQSAPTPAWARESDQCAGIRQCDDCVGEGAYCKYNDMGRPICCYASKGSEPQPEPATLPPIPVPDPEVEATIMPVPAERLPAWAGSRLERCSRVRSCDDCQRSSTRYCKYSSTGQPQCCRPGYGSERVETQAQTEQPIYVQASFEGAMPTDGIMDATTYTTNV